MMRRTGAILLLLSLAGGSLPAQTSTSNLRRIYKQQYASRMVPLLCEAIAFQTEAGKTAAVDAQAQWLRTKADELGLVYRSAGPVTEIELPGPQGAPVLGLMVHGDVQPPGDSGWTVPPYTCTVKDGFVYGRGSADDKGPLVQALLAIAALRTSGRPRTQTVRLLVGSDEESANTDVKTYLETNKPPDMTLVIDSEFPVIVGEKAWDALEVTAQDPYRIRSAGNASWAIAAVEAGVTPSIVPGQATARLRWLPTNKSGFDKAVRSLCPARVPEGYRCDTRTESGEVVITVTGRAAHSGMNIEGGRNALVFLANLLQDKTAVSGASDLLAFAATAGQDLHGSGFGLTDKDPLWGRYSVNVAVLKPVQDGGLRLTTNLRRIPPRTHAQTRSFLTEFVERFNRSRGSSFQVSGYFEDEPFFVPADAKLVRRLLSIYERSTGQKARPAISGGGTYARRIPNAIAFGMWFPGKPYPGHDVNERIPIADLHRGVDVLLEALADFTSSPALSEPLRP